jgi:hypothetical protein
MSPLEKLLKWCKDEVTHVVLCCTSEQHKRLSAAKNEAELMAALHECALENAVTPPCPVCPGNLERVMADEPWATATYQCTRCEGTFEIGDPESIQGTSTDKPE